MRSSLSRARVAEAVFVCATAGVVYGLVNRTLVFGSDAGRWVYPYVQGATPAAVLVAVLAAIAYPLAFQWSARRADAHAPAVVAAWLALGAGFQAIVRQLYPVQPARIVASPECNSFFSVSLQHAPLEVLTDYEAIAPLLPLHAQANMPGKLFVYYLLELFSRNPGTLALGVLALSALGAALVFAVTRRLFQNSRAATLAMVLSLTFPAMVAFQPLLNTVSPLFALMSFALWVVYLERRQDRFLWLLGGSLYVQTFVDPLTLVLGLVFLGVLAERLARREFPPAMIVRAAVIPVIGFIGVHVVIRGSTGFDIVSVFARLAGAAAVFNLDSGRPYQVWLFQNLKEFFLGAGIVPSIASMLSLILGCRAATRSATPKALRATLRRCLAEPGVAFAASFFLCLLAVDFAGINRGEVTRLWIFLGVFLQIAAAQALVRHFGQGTSGLSVGAVLVQTTFNASMVGFIVC